MQPFKQRIARILPYFATSRPGIVVAILASIVGAATEPVLPALMQPLLDKGFQAGGIPLWLVPIVIIGLFTVRGAAVFIAKYSLSWAANGGILVMRAAMFEHLLAAQPTLFTKHSASSLTNTLVYEVQGGANQLVHSVLGLVRDSLTLVAMLSYLLWLNWKCISHAPSRG
jgi:subfamily B ATP-binding cassette protein MsbA